MQHTSFCKAIMVYLSAWLVLTIMPLQASAPPLLESNARSHPAIFAHAAVASQSQLASTIGANILKQGGNAVDAAVAIAFAETVTLPRAGNLGGGGFMLVWLNHAKKAIAIDYRETAPLAATAHMLENQHGQVDYEQLKTSYLSSGVPGTVAGLWYAHQHYGHLPWATLLQPATKLAQDGVVVTTGLAQATLDSQHHLADTSVRHVFFHQDGRPYQAGERMKRPDLARTLQRIAQQGAKGFYAGTVAQHIVAANQRFGGLITAKDLQTYKVKIRQPASTHYRGYTIITMPPPSSGGVTLIEMLNTLSQTTLSPQDALSAKRYHLLTEVMNLAYHDRNIYLGDPDFVAMPIHRLLSPSYAKQLYQHIDLSKHTATKRLQSASAMPESRETTHFSVIDSDGNMVANTYTLNYSFGNGRIIPGTGILMNNEMLDFTAKVGVANPFGLVQGANNAIAAGKRPLSSMSPVLVLTHDGQPYIATGTPGGSRIISTMLQWLVHVIDDGYNIAQATDAPRMHSQAWPDVLYHEQGLSPDTLALLRSMGHHLQLSRAMGAVQSVAYRHGMVSASVDARRIGAGVAGY